jgi:hypothetical protein
MRREQKANGKPENEENIIQPGGNGPLLPTPDDDDDDDDDDDVMNACQMLLDTQSRAVERVD